MAGPHCGSQNRGPATTRPADPAAGARTAMNESIREQKSALRRRIRNELERLPPGARLAASAQACSRLRQERIWREAGSVLLYAPLADEPDVEPLWRGAPPTPQNPAPPPFGSGNRRFSAPPGLQSPADSEHRALGTSPTPGKRTPRR